ncbi:TrmO family methyltransferase domain-containing protein [Acetivibrio mesophilus]|uniref:SAM-dependent methyltransferase n=1 Tax=Acetivibrio mesophilus TaxID=2487273 RepID=A0A4Q0I8A4_9FIRM|nr:TrmO family methyltransferase [Acetivibrio mesophilus]ODM26330.1 tRNA-Thr(GGU) m(6)t(6)A37 methyltransferase TsaA [Clostridium sp. Bc-iso-3]RXE60613.1 SAM-dependent methyltransferase [Acetivibrio mesophilus]HHV30388.1 SAM-dependent methyltransferase [Clostridium sp.]
MSKIKIIPIGKIKNENGDVAIKLDEKYTIALKGLEDYSHVQIIWWMDGCDNETDRAMLIQKKPYKNGPDEIGVFALRSPERPNPIGVSNAQITFIDVTNGTIGLTYVDANNGSTILDIKPYTPSIDRVENPITPDWCGHWPKSFEESGVFDWAKEFNF